MAIHYSYSRLTKPAGEKVEVFSTFHISGDFHSYVVAWITSFAGTNFQRSEKSFGNIVAAESFHAAKVIELNDADGFTLETSSCK